MHQSADFPFTWFQVVTSITNLLFYLVGLYTRGGLSAQQYTVDRSAACWYRQLRLSFGPILFNRFWHPYIKVKKTLPSFHEIDGLHLHTCKLMYIDGLHTALNMVSSHTLPFHFLKQIQLVWNFYIEFSHAFYSSSAIQKKKDTGQTEKKMFPLSSSAYLWKFQWSMAIYLTACRWHLTSSIYK